MRKLDREPEIMAMAGALRLGADYPTDNIIQYCFQRISGWCAKVGGFLSIDDVEAIVCENLNMVFEEFYDDDGLTRIQDKYLALGEGIFKTLPSLFDQSTFATLIERRKITGHSKDRYVAIIDCRGDKAARRFFTRWHEIAHVLTLYSQLELPLHRSTSNKDAIEKLMDLIAGKIGFYAPILNPLLAEEIQRTGYLSFEGVDQIRTRFSSSASFQATLNACVDRIEAPAVVLEAGWAFKKEEIKLLQQKGPLLELEERPQKKFRVLSLSPNAAARGKIEIHSHIEIPSSSALTHLVLGEILDSEIVTTEDLGTWKHSSGKSLPSVRVRIEARRTNHGVLALIQLATQIRPFRHE